MSVTRKYPRIGVCGLDCGLCPRYYTVGKSRCPGCGGPDFSEKHPSCSFITCCVKKKGLEVCAECPDFPCSKFESEEEYQQLKESSSYPSYKKVMGNLHFIQEHGIEAFAAKQEERIKLLEALIENFGDGRSKSFFCKAAALLTLEDLRSSVDKATVIKRKDKISDNDVRSKAQILKEILKEVAVTQGVKW